METKFNSYHGNKIKQLPWKHSKTVTMET